MEATTRQRPAGATSTGDGEPLPGFEDEESRLAGATSQEAEVEDGKQLSGAEDEESRPRARWAGATSQEAEARPRTESHCPGPKMRNKDHQGRGNLSRGQGRPRTGNHYPGPNFGIKTTWAVVQPLGRPRQGRRATTRSRRNEHQWFGGGQAHSVCSLASRDLILDDIIHHRLPRGLILDGLLLD